MAQIDNTASLTGFKALSFDCYGTLIEWEPGLLGALRPILDQLGSEHPWTEDPQRALLRFDDIASALEREQPTLRYDRILAAAMRQLAGEAGEAGGGDGGVEVKVSDAEVEAMARGPGRWPAFPDTLAALAVLKRHYKLAILSNMDNDNMARTTTTTKEAGGGGAALAGVAFDAVYTAEDIGSYKPRAENFAYLHRRARDELGVDVGAGELLHVARSLRVDHSAAKAVGFPSCWIARGGDAKGGEGVGGDYDRMWRDGEVSFQWKFDTLGDFAREVARQFGDEEA